MAMHIIIRSPHDPGSRHGRGRTDGRGTAPAPGIDPQKGSRPALAQTPPAEPHEDGQALIGLIGRRFWRAQPSFGNEVWERRSASIIAAGKPLPQKTSSQAINFLGSRMLHENSDRQDVRLLHGRAPGG
jgi:hypothetical protein